MDKFAFENVLIDAFNEYGADGEYYINTPGMYLKFGFDFGTMTVNYNRYILTVELHIKIGDDAELVKEFVVKWDELDNPQGLVAHCKLLFDDAINRYQAVMSALYAGV